MFYFTQLIVSSIVMSFVLHLIFLFAVLLFLQQISKNTIPVPVPVPVPIQYLYCTCTCTVPVPVPV